MRHLLLAGIIILSSFSASAVAENYTIDTKGSHAFIQFRIKHLGYSWLYGRFNKFDGGFKYDEKNPATSSVTVNIDPASVDTNHAERDKHIRNKDFLHVTKFPTAKFVSTSFEEKPGGQILIKGNFTLHGVTKEIVITGNHIGHGKDPWGGYRRGFSGTTTFALKDFGINYNLGPASEEIEIILSIEGIRQ
ncbi:MAG: YceI family protein [Gammaproteobacteria bacterium]|nr:YceI family protein [Gammaproteobacteria bacterium]